MAAHSPLGKLILLQVRPVFQGHEQAAVIGSGAVYIVEGRSITHTNASENKDQAISVFGATVHVLNSGDRFDLANRAPTPGRTEDIESGLVEVS
jgi:cyanophycinase